MSQVVVFWSGTGNTEAIANKIAADLGCDCLNVLATTVDDVLNYDVLILGCPAMGAEELESDEFRPFYEELMSKAGNKKIALFGSYGWGDGEWMRSWEEETKSLGGNLAGEGLIVNGDDSAIEDDKYLDFIDSVK